MLDPLYTLVGSALRVIHSGFAEFVDPDSAVAWAGSIMVLVILLRLALLPVSVKQARAMQRMQLNQRDLARELAPQLKVLQERHKGDRATLQAETMKLYAEAGKSPFTGVGGAFLPILIQAPIFFGVFKVLQAFQPGASARYGLSAELLEAGANARILGAPIAAALTSSADKIQNLGGMAGSTRIVAGVLLLVMGATMYLTQLLAMRRSAGLEQTAQQQQMGKVLLVVIPLMIVVFGVAFPIGVLLYWFTSNLWTLGQQSWIHRRLGPLPAAATSASVVGSQELGSGPVLRPKTKPAQTKPAQTKPAAAPRTQPGGSESSAASPQPAGPQKAASAQQRAGAKRAAGTRKNKRKRR